MARLATLSTLCAMLCLAVVGGAGAETVDLTTDGAFGWLNGAFFLQVDPPGAQGTGNFDPFLRIQANRTESGYNTDGPLEFDTKAGVWTHIIDLQSTDRNVPIIDGSTVPGLVAGVGYREFVLDINETSPGKYLSLDTVQIFQSNTSTNTGYPNLGTKIFDLDLGTDNWVKLNYELNPGSGQGDVAMYLPDSLFSQRYVYFYSKFGGQGGIWDSDDGFEEWGVIDYPDAPVPVVPEWSSIFLALSGLASVAGLRRRTRLL